MGIRVQHGRISVRGRGLIMFNFVVVNEARLFPDWKNDYPPHADERADDRDYWWSSADYEMFENGVSWSDFM